MLIFMSLGIHFWTVFQSSFFLVFARVEGSLENMVLKYTKEPKIVCVPYIVWCVHLNKNISDLWSL